MRNKIFAFLILFFSIAANSQTIPADRITDWSHAGYPGSIPEPNTILNVKDFGAVGDGNTDDANAIRTAIDSLHGRRGVIFFPAGDYKIRSTIDIPDSVILKGVSPDSMQIIIALAGAAANGFNITGSSSGNFTAVLSLCYRGSNMLNVTDASLFSAGDFAELIEDNGSWDTDPVSWANNSVGQILHIVAINGNSIIFDTPLRINYDTSLNVRIQKIFPALEVGIECMKISRQDNVTSGVAYNINFNYAANCWIRGVNSDMSVGSHIEIDASTNISIRGCYIHHSFLYDGVSTHGYGITLFAHTGQCLIENNIMQYLRHSFSLQTGANGNVIAYNYSFEPNRSEIPSDASADISLHGHYPFSNLFEGNIVQNIQIDQTHGPNGPFNTFFRNRAELYGIVMSSGAVQNDSMNFVGNEVTNTGFLMGNYALVGSGHFEFGNNIKGIITPTGTTPLPDTSYYLKTYPTYWTNYLFPSIGIPNAIGSGSNPAKDQIPLGHFTSCNDDITIDISENDAINFSVYPNPASSYIRIINASNSKEYSVKLVDLNGKIILRKIFTNQSQENELKIPEQIGNGIYILEIFTNQSKLIKKISIIR